jgi:fumarate reductase subunit D
MFRDDDGLLDITFKMSMIGGAFLLYLLFFMMIDRIDRIAHATENMASGPVLPAGVYICDGERCVIANNENLQR